MAVWIRVSELPLEVMNTRFLRKLGNCLGTLFKIDLNTSQQERGKFARLCVEIEMDKPLDTYIRFANFWCKLEYEGLGLICFHYGKFGHNKEGCPKQKSNDQSDKGNKYNSEREIPDQQIDDPTPPDYGPWMQVPLSYRGKKTSNNYVSGSKGKSPSLTGSRFKALEVQQGIAYNAEQNEDSHDKVGPIFKSNPLPKPVKKRTKTPAKSRPSPCDFSNLNPKNNTDPSTNNNATKLTYKPKPQTRNRL